MSEFLTQADENIFRKHKNRKAPEFGEFRVYQYDDNDEPILASKVIFTSKADAIEYIQNHCDPKRDPYFAYRKA